MDQSAKSKYINVQTSFVALCMDRDGTRVAIESPRCVCSLYNVIQIGGRYTNIVYLKSLGLG